MIGHPRRAYLPAAGHDWLLPLYDPLVKVLGADRARQTLLDQVTLRGGERVLDIGCGTGTLVMLIKQLHPDADVVGLDPDPRALARARRKAQRAAVAIQLDQGFSEELPYREGSFDRVFSSFMLHHLGPDVKQNALREVRRVLKPGGFAHIVDFRGPDSDADGFFSRWVQSSHHFEDNSEERILALMRLAELADPRTVDRGAMLFGLAGYCYYSGRAPAS